jgi:hypothetical protein
MVLTGERTLSDTLGARQNCPRTRQTAPDNYVYGLSGALKNRLQRADQSKVSGAKLRHSPGMPATEKHKLVYETPNYVISHAAARWYHCTTVNYRDSSVSGYHDKTVLPSGVSPCLCSYDKTVCGQPVSSVAPLLVQLITFSQLHVFKQHKQNEARHGEIYDGNTYTVIWPERSGKNQQIHNTDSKFSHLKIQGVS